MSTSAPRARRGPADPAAGVADLAKANQERSRDGAVLAPKQHADVVGAVLAEVDLVRAERTPGHALAAVAIPFGVHTAARVGGAGETRGEHVGAARHTLGQDRKREDLDQVADLGRGQRHTEEHHVVEQALEIPPNIYHGYKALIPGTILMYYITEKYDKVSMYDDKRAPIGYFGEDWSTPSK